MSENKCPKCGASISENKQYCSHCGASLSLAIEAPIIIEEKAKPKKELSPKPKKELSPKTKKRLKIAGIAVAASAVVGTTIGLLVPFVFVPLAQISEVKNGNIFIFDKIGDSYSVSANPSLKKYFDDYLPSEINIPSEYKGLPVTEIGYDAFYGCDSLTSITIPNSITSIGNWAFSGCSSLTSITIPNGVASIGKCVFQGCSSLTSVTIPNGVTSIGERAFSGCSSLTSITIPNGVTSIGEGAFRSCSSLTSITIPFVGGSATSNGYFGYLFGGSDSVPNALKEVVISDGCTSIGDRAFYGCSSLTSITIPNGVTSIGDYSFYHCSSLTSITIPNGVTSIGDYAFYGCYSLTSIAIPNGVTSIGDCAFYGCDNLNKIFYAGSAAEWSSISMGPGNYVSRYMYYYSEEEPTGSGNYWHYVDGVPTIWEI